MCGIAGIITFGTDVSTLTKKAAHCATWSGKVRSKTCWSRWISFPRGAPRGPLSRVLSASGALAAVIAVDPPEYTCADWWRHEEGLISFLNEVIKFAYYHIKYWVVLSHHGH